MSEHMPEEVTPEDIERYDKWNEEVIGAMSVFGRDKALALTRSGSWLLEKLVDGMGVEEEKARELCFVHGRLSVATDPWLAAAALVDGLASQRDI